MNKAFEKTRQFIYRTARPLELAIDSHHFENNRNHILIALIDEKLLEYYTQ